MTTPKPPISVRQAQTQADLVVHAVEVPGATVELCAFPELQAESILVTEEQSILSLGLSRLLDEAEGRFARAPRFRRFGSLNFRPAGLPFELRVSQGSFHTIRCRLDERALRKTGIQPAALTSAQLEACLDIHAPRIEDNMLRLAEEVADPAEDTPALVAALVTTITLDLSRYLAEAGRRQSAHRGGLGPRHLRLIFSRMTQPGPAPSIEELASLCGLSRYHFMRAFKESTGESPGAYARRMLMARARNLIASDDRPLAEIARELGFTSAAAFSSAFRRSCGRSPRAWRASTR